MASHDSVGRVVTAGAMELRPTSGCTGRRASTLFRSFEHLRAVPVNLVVRRPMPRVLLLLLVLAACAPGGATMVVENRSRLDVSNVIVSVREAEYRIAALRPGDARAFSAKPRGESGVSLSYTVAGRTVNVPQQGYFENDAY